MTDVIDNVDYFKLWCHLHEKMEMLVGTADQCIDDPGELANHIRGAMEWCERNGPRLFTEEGKDDR